VPLREPQKSFGQQETFATDVTDEEYIEATLRRMADNLFAKVREERPQHPHSHCEGALQRHERRSSRREPAGAD